MLQIPDHEIQKREVSLMITCLCDAIYADVAQATVEILEYLGVEVDFPEGQTCCGQPAFNSGDWDSCRQVVKHTLSVFSDSKSVVLPSGSCAAMVHHGMKLAFEKKPEAEEIHGLSRRTFELCDFIVRQLKVEQWPGVYHRKVAFHRACHTRGSCSASAAVQLLSSIEGLELCPFGEEEQCCGFGGTFSVSFPNLSVAMGEVKLGHILDVGPDEICSSDMSCLMHLGGILKKQGVTIPGVHVAQILRDALKNSKLL